VLTRCAKEMVGGVGKNILTLSCGA